jgi:phosphoribosylanthranilate isomerase
VLLDAKPPSNATTTGGHSTRFDWSMLSEWHAPKPWLLAGGLTPDSVKAAIAQTNPTAVDVASGVEEPRGEKSIAKIRAFLAQVRS